MRASALSCILSLLLIATSDVRTEATPLIAVQVLGQIVVGTNTVDNDGFAACKIFAGSENVLIKASHFSRIRTTHGVVADSGDGLWKALQGRIGSPEARVVSALEASAKELRKYYRTDGRDGTRTEYLASMESHIVLVTLVHGTPILDVFVVQIEGWDNPHAKIVRFPTTFGSPSVRLEWSNTGKPQISRTFSPLDPTQEVNDWLGKIAAENERNPNHSYGGKPVTAAVDSHGIHWLTGEPTACKDERKRIESSVR